MIITEICALFTLQSPALSLYSTLRGAFKVEAQCERWGRAFSFVVLQPFQWDSCILRNSSCNLTLLRRVFTGEQSDHMKRPAGCPKQRKSAACGIHYHFFHCQLHYCNSRCWNVASDHVFLTKLLFCQRTLWRPSVQPITTSVEPLLSATGDPIALQHVGHKEHGLMVKHVIPVCVDWVPQWVFITGRGLRDNWFTMMKIFWVTAGWSLCSFFTRLA